MGCWGQPWDMGKGTYGWAVRLWEVDGGGHGEMGDGTERYVPAGTRYQLPGTWHQVPGTSQQVGTWYQVPGTRYQAHAPGWHRDAKPRETFMDTCGYFGCLHGRHLGYSWNMLAF